MQQFCIINKNKKITFTVYSQLSHSTREEETPVELKTTLITQNRIHVLAGTQHGDLKTFNNQQQTWRRTHYI